VEEIGEGRLSMEKGAWEKGSGSGVGLEKKEGAPR